MSIRLENPFIIDGANKHQKYQFQLVAIVLFTILISILGIGCILSLKEFDASENRRPEQISTPLGNVFRASDSSGPNYNGEMATIAQSEKREFREFFLKLCQMILLNLLLPILTATLGFKMGANSEE